MPLGLNKYSMHTGLSHAATHIQIYRIPLWHYMKVQPQSHGQWGVKFLKRKNERGIRKQKEGQNHRPE